MSRVHLERIEIRNLFARTFDHLQLDGLSNQVTVVYGPNAAGKTVLAQGASRIFSAVRNHVSRSDRIFGRVKSGEQVFEIDLAGPRESSLWPQSARIDLYRLSIADLIAGPQKDDQLRIREALAGGFDFQQVVAQKAGRVPKQDLDSSLDTLRVKRQNAEQLRQQESELPKLAEELAVARQLADDGKFVERWIEAAGHKEDADGWQAQIDSIEATNPGIARQADSTPQDINRDWENYQSFRKALTKGGEALRSFGGRRARKEFQACDEEELSRLTKEAAALDGALTQAIQTVQRASAQKADVQQKLLDHRPDGGRAPASLTPLDRQTLVEMVDAVNRTAEASREMAARCGESARALAGAQTAYHQAGGDAGRHAETAPALDDLGRVADLDVQIAESQARVERATEVFRNASTALEAARMDVGKTQMPGRKILEELQKEPRIAALMDKVRESQERKAAFAKVAGQLGQDAKEKRAAADGAETAGEALRDWLRAMPEAGVAGKPIGLIITAFALALISVGIGLAGWPRVGMLVGAAGLVIIGLLLLFMRKTTATGAVDRRPEAAKRVPEKWRPAEWNADTVAAQFAAAIGRIQALAAAEQAARDAGIRAEQIDDKAVRGDLASRLASFSKATGIQPGDGYDLADFVHRIQKLMDAELGFAGAEKNLNVAKETHAKLVAERADALAALGTACQTGSSAKVWADALRNLIAVEKTHAGNTAAATTADSEATNARDALREFFERFNWPANGDAQTARAGFEKWFELTQRLADAEAAALLAEGEIKKLGEAWTAICSSIRELFQRYAFTCPTNPVDGIKSFRAWFEKTQAMAEARSAAKSSRRQLLNRLRDNGIPEGMPLARRVLEPSARHEHARRRRDLVSQAEASRAKAKGVRSAAGWEEAFERLGLGRDPGPADLLQAHQRLADGPAEVLRLQELITTTRDRLKQAAQIDDLAGAEKSLAGAVCKLGDWLSRKLDEVAMQAVKDQVTEAVRIEDKPEIIRRANIWLGRFTGERYRDLDATDKDVFVTDGLEESRKKKVEQLSTGTRTHLALAVRLAVIEVSETTGHRFPLFLDEVMATSDPHASQAIADSLGEIAGERQVIVLTNQPDDVNLLRGVLGSDLGVMSLAAAQAPFYEPVAIAPELVDVAVSRNGMPIASSIDQWPSGLLAAIVPELNADGEPVYDARQRLDPARRGEVEARLAALEAVRSKCAQAHRRLQWADIEEEDWIKDSFRDRIQQALEASNGQPAEFLIRFRQLERMREVQKQDCERWLIDNGYRVDPPSMKTLTELALEKLPPDYHNRQLIAQGLAAFFADWASR